jgi:hypothetical protein
MPTPMKPINSFQIKHLPPFRHHINAHSTEKTAETMAHLEHKTAKLTANTAHSHKNCHIWHQCCGTSNRPQWVTADKHTTGIALVFKKNSSFALDLIDINAFK